MQKAFVLDVICAQIREFVYMSMVLRMHVLIIEHVKNALDTPLLMDVVVVATFITGRIRNE